MSEAVVESSILETEFMQAMAAQIRASAFCTHEGLSGEALYAPWLNTTKNESLMPCAVADPMAGEKIGVFFRALAQLIERECGHLANSAVSVSPQGFARALITVGKLVVVDKSIREACAFGFASLEKMQLEADKLESVATTLIGEYPQIAGL